MELSPIIYGLVLALALSGMSTELVARRKRNHFLVKPLYGVSLILTCFLFFSAEDFLLQSLCVVTIGLLVVLICIVSEFRATRQK